MSRGDVKMLFIYRLLFFKISACPSSGNRILFLKEIMANKWMGGQLRPAYAIKTVSNAMGFTQKCV